MGKELAVHNEETLLEECRAVYSQQIERPSTEVIGGFWQLGKLFIKYESEGWIDRKYGNNTVRKIAADLGMSHTQLYAAIALAEKCPTKKALGELYKDMQQRSISVSWTSIKTKVLPSNAGVPREDRQHELLSDAERMAGQLEDKVAEVTKAISLTPKNSPEREELHSVRSVLADSLKGAKQQLSQLAIPRKVREGDKKYIAWLKKQPEWACIITGDVEADPHHIQTVGSGGSDALVVPLTREEHNKAQKDSDWYFRNRVKLAEWFYSKAAIDIRWLGNN